MGGRTQSHIAEFGEEGILPQKTNRALNGLPADSSSCEESDQKNDKYNRRKSDYKYTCNGTGENMQQLLNYILIRAKL